ncbi:polysaccharide lyase [Paenibacillus sp. HB172176]|uniref:polysaccharide lyase n=1 Tax=Paenibacillus sp. HB172176 TaxID=2493690 RepID=UPI001438F954|nr:S-layer homology domain-containing protein [Paenibacillus sp. HB172176]
MRVLGKRLGMLAGMGLMLVLGSAAASAASLDNSFESGTAGGAYGLEDWMDADWSAPWLLGDDRSEVDDEISHSGFKSLKILYPEGKIGPQDSGYQAPFELAPADEYYLSYWVRFDEDFSWGSTQFGGKLGIGLAGGASCSGGQICTGENGFSSRLIWRKDGQAAVYIYSMGNAGQYGDEADLTYYNGSPIYYPKEEWFNIVQRVKVNTVTNGEANPDGEIQIWYNGQEATKVTGLRFVTNSDKVDKAYFSTFYGGATEDYAPANDSYIWYDDVKVSSLRSDMCELDKGGCDYKDPMMDYRIAPISVTASVYEEGNGPENTIDDDLTTRWSAEGEQWIQYDLGENHELSQISLAFYQSSIRSTIFRIETSEDGEAWSTQFDGQSSSRFTELEPFALDHVTAKYIRISGSGNTINNWNSITEAVIYGTEKNGGSGEDTDPGTENPGNGDPDEDGGSSGGDSGEGTPDGGSGGSGNGNSDDGGHTGGENPGTGTPDDDGNNGSETPGTGAPDDDDSGNQDSGTESSEVDLTPVKSAIAGHWAEASFIRAAELRIWDVPQAGEAFHPNKPITRADWVRLLVRALDLPAPPAGAGASAFADLAGLDEAQKTAIASAAQAGIINGFADGSFRPQAEVARAQMAVMLARALKLASAAEASSLYADDAALPDWSRDSVYALSAQGVLQGRGGKAFAPEAATSIAEALVALLRAVDLTAAALPSS